MPRRPAALLLVLATAMATACTDAAPSADPEQRFLEGYRAELDALLGDGAPEYTDDELLTFGRRACQNLVDVPDAATLRENIEAAESGTSASETLQVAQATVLVTVAAEHLCPDQGERLGLTEPST